MWTGEATAVSLTVVLDQQMARNVVDVHVLQKVGPLCEYSVRGALGLSRGIACLLKLEASEATNLSFSSLFASSVSGMMLLVMSIEGTLDHKVV